MGLTWQRATPSTLSSSWTEPPAVRCRTPGVVLLTRHAERGDEFRANALNSPVAPERYQARLSLDSPGTWLVSVEVTSSLGKIALEVGSLEVPATRRFSVGSIVFAGAFGVLILGGVYLWWSTRKLRRKR